jgi:hypothetical protein
MAAARVIRSRRLSDLHVAHLFFLHFTVVSASWTAIRSDPGCANPLRAQLGSVCAEPRQKTGQDRRDRLVDGGGGSGFTLIKKWSKRISRGLDVRWTTDGL